MLTQEDWEIIAAIVADSLKLQIMHQASALENLGDEINIKIVYQT
ncbi:hypothetical protein [Nostoc sp. ChiQUE01b]|nr:hypothetical protein [Nostoc sp. ChiQUE01b]MDZ8261426.1 hypothetical protein [Nostoc sp. ChiQUE01b]